MRVDSNKIKLMLAEEKLTQSEFAKRAGVSRQGLNAILIKGTCLAESLLKIAQALKVQPEELIKVD